MIFSRRTFFSCRGRTLAFLCCLAAMGGLAAQAQAMPPATPGLSSAATPPSVGFSVQEVTSSKGVKAWLVQDKTLPLISVSFAFRGGVEQDPVDKQGLAEISTALLTQGAGALDAQAFQQKLADRSIRLGFSAARDSLQGSLKTLRSTRREAFSLLRLALTEPRFDPQDFERIRNQQMTAMQAEMGSPSWQARRALFSTIFGAHPYALRHYGTKATLANVTRQDAAAFAKRHLARDNLLVAVTGDISAQELAKTLDLAFGDLPAHASLTPVADASFSGAASVTLVRRPGTQTEMLFALPTLARADPDWYAASIVNYILGGGGFSSRLMNKVRDQEGLTYGIQTGLVSMDHASLLMGQAATDNDKTGQAWETVVEVWRDLFERGVTDEEIEAAKAYLTGALPLAMASTDAIADTLLGLQLDHLGRDYLTQRAALIRNVTDQDIRRVIKRWFDPKDLALVLVGQPDGPKAQATIDQVTE